MKPSKEEETTSQRHGKKNSQNMPSHDCNWRKGRRGGGEGGGHGGAKHVHRGKELHGNTSV